MTSSSVLVVLIICSVEIGNVCKAVPVDLEADLKDTPEKDILEYGSYFEGDLDISQEQKDTFYEETAMISTTAIRDLTRRWPEGKMYYAFDSSIGESLKSHIKHAMEMWSSRTCIKFIPRKEEKDYVYFTSHGGGCSSNHVGHSGVKQTINLESPGCTRPGTIAHELGHNLGLWHEHTRPDRDKYIRVNLDNVIPGDLINFRRRTSEEVDSQGLEYDYGSIMHYRSSAFSVNGKPTIEIINKDAFHDEGSPNMGQREHLSERDIAVMNRLYCED